MQAASASNPGTDARVVARKFTRARIIAHIRGIAAENGGVPPGKMQFQSKTGIKPSAWAGRLWARWSDALREAGFAPNARTSRLRDDDMLGWLADQRARSAAYPPRRIWRCTGPPAGGFPAIRHSCTTSAARQGCCAA